MPSRYPFLHLVVILFRGVGILTLLLTGVSIIAALQGAQLVLSEGILLLQSSLACVSIIAGTLMALALFASAEWIKLHLDMEEHARAMRGLLRRQSQSETPPEWARDPHGVWRER
jgi:hypothetical protein